MASNRVESFQLELKLFYAVVVAGKSARFAARVVQRLFPGKASPFRRIRGLISRGELLHVLRKARTGSYRRVHRAFREIVSANIDLHTCTPADLERIHGIGPKTSRFYIKWTRPGFTGAVLDTHILKWLRFLGYTVPCSTPSKSRYADVEKLFLEEAARRGATPAEMDTQVWEFCRNGRHKMNGGFAGSPSLSRRPWNTRPAASV